MDTPDDRFRMRLFPVVAVLCGLLLVPIQSALFAQPPASQQPAQPQQEPIERLSADQLNALVAPIALYPDPLLSQVLAASTYPLEVVEACQWLQQNPQLSGSAAVDAAQQQDWDPSVQALVLFPDVLKQLSENVKWTTALGNAFLAQEADLMDAVQRLRNEALAAGKLASTPQETVTTQTQGGQTVVQIVPANPEIVYVPVYSPAYVWGPSIFDPYPWLYWPGYYHYGPGISFGFGVRIGPVFFGCCDFGWGGWGWGPNWFGRTIIVNNNFFHRYRFRGSDFGRGVGGGAWAHNPIHRLGVPYPNRQLATNFYNNSRGNAANGARVPRPPDGVVGRASGFARGTSAAPGRAPAPSGRGLSSAGAERTQGSVAGTRVAGRSTGTTPTGGVRAAGASIGGARAGTAPTGGMRVGTPATSGTRNPGASAGSVRTAPTGGVRTGTAPTGGMRVGTPTTGGTRIGAAPSGGVRMGTAPTARVGTANPGMVRTAPSGSSGGMRVSGAPAGGMRAAPMGGTRSAPASGMRAGGASGGGGGGARMAGGGGGGARMSGGGGGRTGGARR